VYDLGGGTFDVSLIHLGAADHAVVATDGASELGGDDFDRAIADLVADRARLGPLTAGEERALLAECCARKEALTPQARKVAFDLASVRAGAADLTLPVDEVLAACAPLVARTVALIEDLVAGPGSPIDEQALAGVYVVGGASGLPSVGRLLRERFGRRVHRSPYSFAATAIGLAIAADAAAPHTLTDCFTRHFGVWREADAGARAVFDPIFAKDTPLPPRGEGPLTRVRRYRARHDIGHFRFLECSRLDGAAAPSGDLHLGREVRFPFATALRGQPLDARLVAPLDEPAEVEERYECDADGIVRLTVTSADGFARRFDLA
jgi:molecular chaperone DnaK (HSP70)